MTCPYCSSTLPREWSKPCAECRGCRNCGAMATKNGRCDACYQYRRRTGTDRPLDRIMQSRQRAFERELQLRTVLQMT